MLDGYLNKCKDCTKKDTTQNRLNNLEYYKDYDRNRSHGDRVKNKAEKHKEQYRSNDEFRDRIRKLSKESEFRRKLERDINNKLSNAIRDGKVIRPTTCQFCNCDTKIIQGHHWRYDEEHKFDVLWLCPKCHGLEHRRINSCKRANENPYIYGKEYSLYDLLIYCQTLKFDPFLI